MVSVQKLRLNSESSSLAEPNRLLALIAAVLQSLATSQTFGFDVDGASGSTGKALEAVELLGGAEARCAAVLSALHGDISGYVAFVGFQNEWGGIPILRAESPHYCFLKKLFQHFAESLAEHTNLDLNSNDPVIAVEMASAIISSMVADAEWNHVPVFSLNASIGIAPEIISGCILYIPRLDGYKLMNQILVNREAA